MTNIFQLLITADIFIHTEATFLSSTQVNDSQWHFNCGHLITKYPVNYTKTFFYTLIFIIFSLTVISNNKDCN